MTAPRRRALGRAAARVGEVAVAIASAVALLILAAAAPAHAYVRETTQDTGVPVYWQGSCAAVTIYLDGFTQMTADQVAKSIAAAAHAWSPDVVDCPDAAGDAGSTTHPYFEIVPALSTGGPVPEVGNDGKNSIIFRVTDWGNNDPSAIALTSRSTDPAGRIVDADIEINATPSSPTSWANLDPGASSNSHVDSSTDLQTALTHEFGHFLGLGHTCFNTAIDSLPRPVDDQGRPIPDCDDGTDLPEAAAVMWYEVQSGPLGTAKRVLTTDDARGVCAIYPAAQDPQSCTLNLPDDGCGCAAAPGKWRAEALLLVALAAAGVGRRRRRPALWIDR